MTRKFIVSQIKLTLIIYSLLFLLIWYFSSKTELREIAFFSLVDLLVILVPQWFGLVMSIYFMKKRQLKVLLKSHQELPPHWAIGEISFAALFKKFEMMTRIHWGSIAYNEGLAPINREKLRLIYSWSGLGLIIAAFTWPFLFHFAVEKVKLSEFTLLNFIAILLTSGFLCALTGWNWLWKEDDITPEDIHEFLTSLAEKDGNDNTKN